MVKFGKYYRNIQIKEFAQYYINYKELKQKIKQMKKIMPDISQNLNFINKPYISKNEGLFPSISDQLDLSKSYSNCEDKYGNELKDFIYLLEAEFKKCFGFFKSIEKNLNNKLNIHLHNQTTYDTYDLNQICNEANSLKLTVYLAKCLNYFINDNMMAIKKILKKFDKKFSNYFGEIGPVYILNKLSVQNSELEYLLQFQIIEQSYVICESNLNTLDDLLDQQCKENNLKNSSKNEKNINEVDISKNQPLINEKEYRNLFTQRYNEIMTYLKDIDETIYFKIQYKEWFYFINKNNTNLNQTKLFNNIMYNPLLFSPFKNDDLLHKFLSRKKSFKEVEEMQTPLSKCNKINIILIFIQIFFYNTLLSSIYPLLFELMEKGLNKGERPKSFLIIASTYFCSYFSMMFNHYFGSQRIKIAYYISYILFFLGSFLYIVSLQKNKEDKVHTLINPLIGSRILIGLGANPTMGKKYILSYSSIYYLPYISKYYVIIQMLGYAFGPLIGYIYYNMPNMKILFLEYSKYNCIGWYGCFFSLVLFFVHLFFFTPPNSNKFQKFEKENSKNDETDQINFVEDDDLDETQDKEFYRLQDELKPNIINDDEYDNNDEGVQRINSNDFSMGSPSFKKQISMSENDNSFLKTKKTKKFNFKLKKIKTLMDKPENKNIKEYETNPKDYEVNQTQLYSPEKEKEALLNNLLGNFSLAEGSFSNIDMIPRAIDDIIRKEKKKFSYLNQNLLTISWMLFFNSMLKENFIAYFSYFIYDLILKGKKFVFVYEIKNISLLVSGCFCLQLLSIFFISPFYKLNKKIKASLIFLMIFTIGLMIPLSIEYISYNYTFIYISFISIIILVNSIIETISSCYLAYLIPPVWKYSNINAAGIPAVVVIFGKICGCLICLSSFSDIGLLNHHIMNAIIIIGYLITGYYILESKNFRIKAIARIIRNTDL